MDRFNWALDYFDHLPADDLALWCIGETEEKLSFGRLGAYQRVRRIEFGELPKTISGKIRGAELRQQEAARRRDGMRGPAEFWEEDFPELARCTAPKT